MSDTPQLRLFRDTPVTGHTLSVSGTIAHVDAKPADPLDPLTRGVALVEYAVKRTTFDASSKLGVGLTEGTQVVIGRFYPLADQEAARRAIDDMQADVRRELGRRHAAAMGRANGSEECESGPDEDDEFESALRLAQ